MLEGVAMPLVYGGGAGGGREQRRPMWTQHEKAVLRLLMRQYAGVTEFDPPDVHKHPIRNEMWRLLTARYNAHPHVRSRDTKQLRKAWENLKYRARKLGSESQRRQSATNVESSWPLDGVTLPRPPTSPQHQTPISPLPKEAGDTLEWKPMEEECPKDGMENGERACKVEIEEDNSETDGSGQQMVEESSTVLSLHPIVSSLLGGGLSSLASTLPFLTSPPTSLPPGFLLPHTVSSLSAREDTEVCQPAPMSSMDANTTSVATDTTSGINTTSGTSSQSQASYTTTTSTVTTSASSTTPEKQHKDAPATVQERLLDRVNVVETNIRHTEEQHQAQLQLLRLQMAQTIAEHDAKMKVLAAQLEYWQRRLRVQQRVSYALSAISEPDLDDEPLP